MCVQWALGSCTICAAGAGDKNTARRRPLLVMSTLSYRLHYNSGCWFHEANCQSAVCPLRVWLSSTLGGNCQTASVSKRPNKELEGLVIKCVEQVRRKRGAVRWVTIMDGWSYEPVSPHPRQLELVNERFQAEWWRWVIVMRWVWYHSNVRRGSFWRCDDLLAKESAILCLLSTGGGVNLWYNEMKHYTHAIVSRVPEVYAMQQKVCLGLGWMIIQERFWFVLL